jgi:HEAT repeat protein
MQPEGEIARPACRTLTTALNDRQPEVRAAGARALGNIGPVAAPASRRLIELLGDSDVRVRKTATEALARVGATEAVPALIGKLADAEVWEDTASALLHLDPSSIPPRELIRILEADSDGIPRLYWFPDFVTLLASRNQDEIASALAAAGAPVAADLGRLVTSPKKRVRDRVAAALKLLGPAAKDAVPALISALKDESLREFVLDVLAHIGPFAADAVPHIGPLLRNPSSAIRRAGACALAGMGPPAGPAVSDLVALLSDANREVRQWSAIALGRIGRDTDEVVTALRARLRDPSADVRKAAAQSLIAFWR